MIQAAHENGLEAFMFFSVAALAAHVTGVLTFPSLCNLPHARLQSSALAMHALSYLLIVIEIWIPTGGHGAEQ